MWTTWLGMLTTAPFFEEEAVVEGVMQGEAHEGVVAVGAENFLEGGVEERAGGEEFTDVKGLRGLRFRFPFLRGVHLECNLGLRV